MVDFVDLVDKVDVVDLTDLAWATFLFKLLFEGLDWVFCGT